MRPNGANNTLISIFQPSRMLLEPAWVHEAWIKW